MEWWVASLLGLVQGLTEFLPVSSSGHLVLAQAALGVQADEGLLFEVLVHLGTALSIVTVYGRQLGAIAWDMLRAVRRPVTTWRQSQDARTGGFILLTLLPTGIVYLLFAKPLEATFDYPALASAMLLVTGVLLLLTVKVHPYRHGKLTWAKALVVGLAQGAALLPGISRSGATICAALYQKVTPQTAADFAFLMAVPVIFGAALIKGWPLLESPQDVNLAPLVIGTLAAYLSGMAAIKVVLGFVQRGRLHYFAYYCFGIGTLGLILIYMPWL